MKKQFKNSIFKTVLLLLSVVLLVASAVVVAVSAASTAATYRTLTVDLDGNVKTCVVEYTDVTGKSVSKVVNNGDVIDDISHGTTVVVTVTPQNGMWPNFSFGNETYQGIAVGNRVRWKEFVVDNTITVRCENRTYTLVPLNYDLTSDFDYYLEPGDFTFNDLLNGAITYTAGTESVRLPNATMGQESLWTFAGWYIKTAENNGALISQDTETGLYYIPKDILMTEYMYEQGDVIYVYPKFTPPSYDIYRDDYIYYRGGELSKMFSFTMKAEADTRYSAIWSNFWTDDINAGGYVSYKGYLLLTHMCTTPCGKEVCDVYGGENGKPVLNNKDPNTGETIKEVNTQKRYYTPITYHLTYVDVPAEYVGPGVYVYGINTYESDEVLNKKPIADPTKEGYAFLGWKVELYDPDTDTWYNPHEADENKYVNPGFALGDKNAYYDSDLGEWIDPNDKYAAKANADGIGNIRLTARWSANTYHIEYKWGEGVSAELETELNNTNTLPKSFVFDSGVLEIINPKRPGYTFSGWVCSYTDAEGNPQTTDFTHADGKTLLNCSSYAQNITLTAKWQAKIFSVVFGNVDGIANSDAYTQGIGAVTYDQPINISGFVAPIKTGYNFVGYYTANDEKYINADGTSNVAAWTIDSESSSITLYAKWEAIPCNITLQIEGLPTTVAVTIKFIPASGGEILATVGQAVVLPYDSVFQVIIYVPEGFCLVKWNGEEVADFTGTKFNSDSITVNAENMTLTAEVRPSKPNVGAGQEVDVTLKSETEIQVNFKDAETAQKYDIAISDSEDATDLDWKKAAQGETVYIFGGLDEGTKYHIFVRLSETDTTLAGIPTSVSKTTQFFYFVQNKENELKDLITETDGDCVKILVQLAIDKIYDLIPENGELPENFNQSVADIVAEVKAQLAFARFQDGKIAELQAYRDACGASGSFRQENLAEIGNRCALAVADITAATTEEAVNELFNTAMDAIKAIPMTYLHDTNNFVTLESLIGLNHGAGITLKSIEDIKALRRAIADAIANGMITADSFITIEEATKLLSALDTVAAYSFSLSNVQVSEGDVFTIILTIPEAFINCTGLQVAYFNQATGMVEFIQTVREGNTLIFKAKYIADFVILADPTVDLTGVIIALSAILFCQLLAIVLVLAARGKAKKSVMHASVALPMFLTIHYLPVANAELIALGLGVLVLLAQIVLMWLILSSGMIRVFKTKRRPLAKQEITAVVREEDLNEELRETLDKAPTEEATDNEVVDEVVQKVIDEVFDEVAEELIEQANEEVVEEATEEVVEESTEEALDEEAFDQELANELASEQGEEYADEVYEEEVYEEVYEKAAQEAVEALPEEAEEIYDDEEFIEQEAPETDYSEEEENEYAYSEEETERVSDAYETDQASEDEAYDTDPLAGVFGVSYGPDGDSSDEGGYSQDADGYTEPYEYGDEEDAPYAEAEDADREETEGQGPVDSTAYVVNDEISDDEEMYQYDE